MRLNRHWDLPLFDVVIWVVVIHLGVVIYRFDSAVLFQWRYCSLLVSMYAWVNHQSLESAMHTPSEHASSRRALIRERSTSVWVFIAGMLSYSVTALFLPAPLPSVASVERHIAMLYLVLAGLLIAR